jgi:hypothetical protein
VNLNSPPILREIILQESNRWLELEVANHGGHGGCIVCHSTLNVDRRACEPHYVTVAEAGVFRAAPAGPAVDENAVKLSMTSLSK